MAQRYTIEEALTRYQTTPDFVENTSQHSERVRINPRKLQGLRFALRYTLVFSTFSYLVNLWEALGHSFRSCPNVYGMSESDLRLLLAVRVDEENHTLVPCVYNLSSRRVIKDSDRLLPPTTLEKCLFGILSHVAELHTIEAETGDKYGSIFSLLTSWRIELISRAMEAASPLERRRAELYAYILDDINRLKRGDVQRIEANTDYEQAVTQALDQFGDLVTKDDRQFLEQLLAKVYAAGRNAGYKTVIDESYQTTPRYLVGPNGWSAMYPLTLAYIPSAEAARNAYVRRECSSPKFLSTVYEKKEAPFLKTLLIQTPDEITAYIDDGVVPEADRTTVEKLVREFFDEHPEWAEQYIAYYYGDTTPEAARQAALFSEDMLYYIYRKIYQLEAVALRNLPVLRSNE